MPYNRTFWINGQAPARNADNLNKQEIGIESAVYTGEQNSRDIGRIELALRKNNIISGPQFNKFFESPEVRDSESIGLIDNTKAYAATVTQGIDNVDVAMQEGVITDLLEGMEVTMQGGDIVTQEVENGEVTTSVTSDDTGTSIGVLPNGTWQFDNNYNPSEQVFTSSIGDKIFVATQLKSDSTGRVTQHRIKYADGGEVSGALIDDSIVLYDIITATQNSTFNLKVRESTAGLIEREYQMLFSLTGTPFEPYTAEQFKALLDEVGYFEGKGLINQLKENLIVTSVSDPTVTFKSNIANEYPDGAMVYRSNLTENVDKWNFGTFDALTEIDKTTPVQVTASANTTDATARPQRLSNGDLITLEFVSAAAGYILNKSTDSGDNWNQLCSIDGGVNNVIGASIASEDTNVHVVFPYSTSVVNFYTIDTLTQIDTNIFASGLTANLDNQTALGKTSIAIAPNGDLHAAWSSKNATIPLSDNIRHSKSDDGGVTWDSPTQRTSLNNGSFPNGYNSPSIVIRSDGNPVIVFTRDAGTKGIYTSYYNGSVWTDLVAIYDIVTHVQSNPSADVKASGRIVVAWHGRDATYPSAHNIRFSYSDDLGVTWSTMELITTGNIYNQTFVSITRDKDDVVSMLWSGLNVSSSPYAAIRLAQGNTLSWGAIEEITTNTTANMESPSTCNNYRDFDKPISVWMDFVDSDVKFYGKWIEGVSYPLTDVDVRMNIAPPEDYTDIVAWMRITELAGLTVDALASIVASAADESYFDLTDVSTDLGSINEIASSGVTATGAEKVTLKYLLGRASINDVAEILDIVGFMGF